MSDNRIVHFELREDYFETDHEYDHRWYAVVVCEGDAERIPGIGASSQWDALSQLAEAIGKTVVTP
jgi:hypothetical protein